jgi:hypothetical protein
MFYHVECFVSTTRTEKRIRKKNRQCNSNGFWIDVEKKLNSLTLFSLGHYITKHTGMSSIQKKNSDQYSKSEKTERAIIIKKVIFYGSS